MDLQLSKIKPIHARWLVDVLTEVKLKPDVVKQGFVTAGIAKAAETGLEV